MPTDIHLALNRMLACVSALPLFPGAGADMHATGGEDGMSAKELAAMVGGEEVCELLQKSDVLEGLATRIYALDCIDNVEDPTNLIADGGFERVQNPTVPAYPTCAQSPRPNGCYQVRADSVSSWFSLGVSALAADAGVTGTYDGELQRAARTAAATPSSAGRCVQSPSPSVRPSVRRHLSSDGTCRRHSHLEQQLAHSDLKPQIEAMVAPTD